MDIEEFLRKIPRPSEEEIPELYGELNDMTRRIAEVLTASKLYDAETREVDFGKATSEDLIDLVNKDPKVMVPFFVMVTGLSYREFRRRGIKDVYSLRKPKDRSKIEPFADSVKGLLAHPLRLETVLYKFYKNWEEHQKRHWRGRRAESDVCKAIGNHCRDVGKRVFESNDMNCSDVKRREIDCAVPRENPVVAINVRVGVKEDRAKRIKEFAAELSELRRCLPNIKYFVVAYLVPEHEKDQIEGIRAEFMKEASFDLVILARDELKVLVEKLREWKVPGCDADAPGPRPAGGGADGSGRVVVGRE